MALQKLQPASGLQRTAQSRINPWHLRPESRPTAASAAVSHHPHNPPPLMMHAHSTHSMHNGRSAAWRQVTRPLQRSCRGVQTQAAVDTLAATVNGSEYDAAANAEVWGRRPVAVIKRSLRIAVEFARWQLTTNDAHSHATNTSASPGGSNLNSAAGFARGTGSGMVGLGAVRRGGSKRAAAMRELLVRLGPAFVKIGQALSSRPDVLPPSYLVELELLQDRIPAFDTPSALAVLEAELGLSVLQLFTEFSPEPVAAASLGQVYRARLRSNGEEVAVKVQRPGVAEAIACDVFILRWLAALLRKLRSVNTDLPSLVDEWATSLFRELDYRREARNAKRFKMLYENLPGVYVPRMLDQFTTNRVLTMEWVEGQRLRTVADNLNYDQGPGGAAGAESTELDLALVEVGVQCSLEQMLEVGMFHADPHPGNLLRTKDKKLCYLDFGMVGELDAKTRQSLIRATLHLVNREYAPLAQDFIDLGLLPTGSDKEKIIPALTGVFQKALSQGVSNVSFGDLTTNLGQTMYQFSFRIPPYFTLLVRSLTVLEGIALASDPNYKVLASAYPWIARRLLTNRSPELTATLRALLYTDDNRFRFARLESLLQEAVRTPRSLPGADAAAAARRNSPLALLLAPESVFVRDILLDEVAKGIDAGWRVALDSAVVAVRHPLPIVAGLPVVGSLMAPIFSFFIELVPQLDGPATSSPASTPVSTNPSTTSSVSNAGPDGENSLLLHPVGICSLLGGSPSNSPPDLGPELPGPAGALLAALPRLSSSRDVEQLAGMNSLAAALSALAARGDTTSGAREIGGPVQSEGSMQQAAAAMQWLVQELGMLPPEQRAEALQLPAGLAARVASRFAARALRALAGVPMKNDMVDDRIFE